MEAVGNERLDVGVDAHAAGRIVLVFDRGGDALKRLRPEQHVVGLDGLSLAERTRVLVHDELEPAGIGLELVLVREVTRHPVASRLVVKVYKKKERQFEIHSPIDDRSLSR